MYLRRRRTASILVLSFWLLLLPHCTPSHDIYFQEAFSSGKFSISLYEVTKNASRAVDHFRYQNDSLPSRKWIENWFDYFINRTCFLEDARQKGYFNNPSVNDAVSNMSRIIVTQDNGLLSKELIKDVSVNDVEIFEAYKKSQKVYNFYLIEFKNHNLMNRILGKEITNLSPSRFLHLYSLAESQDYPSVSFGKNILSWPFWDFIELENTILNLPENTVTGPIELNGAYFYLFMEKIDNNSSLPSFETIRESVENIVRAYKEVTVMERFRRAVLQTANISINDRSFADLYMLLQSNEGLATSHSEYTGNDSHLFSYFCDNISVTMTAGEFLRHCETMIFNRNITSRIDLENRIKLIAYEKCAYVEAEKRGITRTSQFILDRKNYANAIAYDQYEKLELADKRPISNEDLQNEYSSFPDRYSDGVIVDVTCFVFKSLDEAKTGSGTIFRRLRECIDIPEESWAFRNIEGLLTMTPILSIRYDSENYPPQVKEVLFRMRNGQVTDGLALKNETYGVFVKNNETGTRTKSFNEVKDEVRNNVAEKRLKQNRTKRLKELKKNFPVIFAIPKEKILKLIFDSCPDLQHEKDPN